MNEENIIDIVLKDGSIMHLIVSNTNIFLKNLENFCFSHSFPLIPISY